MKQDYPMNMKNKDIKAVIIQPSYLPWLGYFEQMYQSDIFVIYDDVQYDKNGWRNRNKIKTSQGVQWLTVPVYTKDKSGQLAKDVIINNQEKWQEKHLKSIQLNYSKAPFFSRYFYIFQDAYSKKWKNLVDLDMFFINKIANCLKLNRKIIFSSDLKPEGDKIQRLIDICKKVGANYFYEGASGINYIDEKKFKDAKIKLIYQDYKYPFYKQLHGNFISYLSIVDLLFNYGDASLDILIGKKIIRSE